MKVLGYLMRPFMTVEDDVIEIGSFHSEILLTLIKCNMA